MTVMLGDLLADARRSAGSIRDWLAGADDPLAAELESAAEGERLSVGAFARLAVADFARHADEEAWATLASRIRGAADPGRECLRTMLRWRMADRRLSQSDRSPR